MIKTCWNCGNNGGDKTDHTKNNPCINCDVKWSLGIVSLTPNDAKINWKSQE